VIESPRTSRLASPAGDSFALVEKRAGADVFAALLGFCAGVFQASA
jgi:hypothetical protein